MSSTHKAVNSIPTVGLSIFSGFQLLILTISQLQTKQLMTFQIKSHTEYLIQNYNIPVLI